jgi:hypothetical protein
MPLDGTSFMFLKDVDSSTATPRPQLPISSTASLTSGLSNIDIGGASPAGTSTYARGA